MGSVFRTRDVALPRQGGEMARLKVSDGPDLGVTFVVTGSRASLGRAEDNDIFLADLKASRQHAEILYGNGGWSVEDRGSANGIVHNGRVTRQANLKSGDRITLGSSTLVFIDAGAPIKLLDAPVSAEQAVVNGDPEQQQALARRVEKVRAAARFSLPKGGKSGNTPKKKINPILLIAAMGLAWVLLFDDSGTKPKSPGSSKGASRTITAMADYQPDASINKASDTFFKEGFREYREKNWARAKIQFRNALSVYPGHAMAKIYLENCNRQIVEDVQEHLSRGRKKSTVGKLRGAKAEYEAVLRLLRLEPNSPPYIEAKTELATVLNRLAGLPTATLPAETDRAPGSEP